MKEAFPQEQEQPKDNNERPMDQEKQDPPEGNDVGRPSHQHQRVEEGTFSKAV